MRVYAVYLYVYLAMSVRSVEWLDVERQIEYLDNGTPGVVTCSKNSWECISPTGVRRGRVELREGRRGEGEGAMAGM